MTASTITPTPFDTIFVREIDAVDLLDLTVEYALKSGEKRRGQVRDALDVTRGDKMIRFVVVASLDKSETPTNVWVAKRTLA